MRLIISTAFILSLLFVGLSSCKTKYGEDTIYSYTVKDIDGNDFKMSDLKGKKVLIVNVASKCGLTPQYEKLEALYQKYKDHNFTIIAFPSNNFQNQEPGTNAEIKEFCSLNYGVTFPIMSKIDVIGDNQAPIYQWLTQQEKNTVLSSTVAWNFQKYLIDENGKLFGVSAPKNSPDEDYIVNWIEGRGKNIFKQMKQVK